MTITLVFPLLMAERNFMVRRFLFECTKEIDWKGINEMGKKLLNKPKKSATE